MGKRKVVIFRQESWCLSMAWTVIDRPCVCSKNVLAHRGKEPLLNHYLVCTSSNPLPRAFLPSGFTKRVIRMTQNDHTKQSLMKLFFSTTADVSRYLVFGWKKSLFRERGTIWTETRTSFTVQCRPSRPLHDFKCLLWTMEQRKLFVWRMLSQGYFSPSLLWICICGPVCFNVTGEAAVSCFTCKWGTHLSQSDFVCVFMIRKRWAIFR